MSSALRIRYSATQLAARLAFWGDRCWMCGRSGDLTLDHVKPLSGGGPDILANIRPACVSCNSRKRETWPYPTTKIAPGAEAAEAKSEMMTTS